MNKKIISKVGKRHRPEIDMMEYIQVTENQEFDLDRNFDKGRTILNEKEFGILFSDFKDDIDIPLKVNHDITKTKKVTC